MEVLLILAVVVGVSVGVGFTTGQRKRKYTWVVDAAEDLSALEKCLNHFSEEGFGIHRSSVHHRSRQDADAEQDARHDSPAFRSNQPARKKYPP
jgi:hypothetical protein